MGIVTIDGIPVYQALVTDDECGMLRISLVDDPAVQSNFVAFDAAKKMQMYAVQDEEKRLVLGVVMRADFPIYRRDNRMGEYYIIYKADTIRAMAEKYLAENRQNLVNLMHEDGTEQEGVKMVQYFIKGNGLSPEGFDDIADGSLFAEFHIENDDVWAAIKDGTYRGFSLEGVFDLAPETDKPFVEEVVDILDGMFSRMFKNSKQYKEMKKKGIMARLAEGIAKVFAEMGNITTDRGILSWDGEEELKAGDSVYIEDENGNRAPAADGDYRTDDGEVIVVEGGKVSEIRDAEAPEADAPAEEPQETEAAEEGEEPRPYNRVPTDKGDLRWYGEGEDLKEGDEVFVEDENGNETPAPDGEYMTEDGKTIVVVDGKVAELRDPEAEVAPVENEELVAARAERDAAVEKVAELEAKVAELSAKVAELSAAPKGAPAHIEHEQTFAKTGIKGLDNLSRLMAKK